jgi:hypothetical protein
VDEQMKERSDFLGGESHDFWNDIFSDMPVFSGLFFWRLGC